MKPVVKKKKRGRKTQAGGGVIGLPTLLFLIFLTLKLAEIGPVAEWSWWWVTAPLWAGYAVLGAILILGVMGAIAYELLMKAADSRWDRSIGGFPPDAPRKRP